MTEEEWLHTLLNLFAFALTSFRIEDLAIRAYYRELAFTVAGLWVEYLTRWALFDLFTVTFARLIVEDFIRLAE